MIKVLEAIVVSSFLVLILKLAVPDLIGQVWIQQAALILFGASLPIAFTLSLRKYFLLGNHTQLITPIAYLLSFAVIVGLVFASAASTTPAYHSIQSMNAGYPPKLFSSLVEGEDEQTRRTAAQIIYAEFGAKVPYKGQDSYIVFEPTATDMQHWQETQEMHQETALILNQLSESNIQGISMFFYLIGAFLFGFAATLITVHITSNKPL